MEIDNYNEYNFIIIDIRDENSFNHFNIKNSINIPFYKLMANYNVYLDKNKYYLLVCDHGIESKKTCEILNRMGYKTFSLKNGINNYNISHKP